MGVSHSLLTLYGNCSIKIAKRCTLSSKCRPTDARYYADTSDNQNLLSHLHDISIQY